ncbi:MAG: hypothetical protein ACLP9L_18455 [Thermoguttaceae bacterium]
MPPQALSLKGTLILGEGDKLRLEFAGKTSGVEGKLTAVSDGANMSIRTSGEPDKTKKAPKALGANVRRALLRMGIFICWTGIERSGKLSPDQLKLSDFKLTGEEMIGERKTRVIEYMVTLMQDVITPAQWRMKMWLDAQTSLPVKLTMTMPKGELSDISAMAETYSEITVDASVDAKLFELPK